MRSVRFFFEAFLIGWLVVLAGCGLGDQPLLYGSGGTGGDTTPSTGGEGGSPACTGRCAEWKSALFEDLSMFWIGPPDMAPPCPDDIGAHVGLIAYGGFDVAAPTCPTCSCAPAECAFPQEMHASAAKCANAQNAASIGWDSLALDGACTSQGPIPPGLLCSGVPCTQSLTVAAPTVTPCEPVQNGAAVQPAPTWTERVQECIIGPLDGDGCPNGEACVPPPPDGFALCLYRFGDDLTASDCPAAYPSFHKVYVHGSLQDDRACEPCSCGPSEGADCFALVSAYSDASCATMLGAVTVGLGDPGCVDLPASGVGLGSKEAVWMTQKPGTCVAGGGSSKGGVEPVGAVMLCCEPEPPPAD